MSNLPKSKKAQAYQLFAKGFGPTSAEVKSLGLKGGTRSSYFYDWQKAGSPGSTDSSTEAELIPRAGKVIIESDIQAGPSDETPVNEEEPIDDESIIEDEGTEEQPQDTSEENQPETNGGSGSSTRSNGKKLATMVAGKGLTFAVTLSVKTIMLYQIAASTTSEELTLGDFIDACVEDTYRGRNLDLGLVKLGGNHD